MCTDTWFIDINVVETTLKSNYYGTLESCQALLPLIKEGGRLVNVSSMVRHKFSRNSNSTDQPLTNRHA